MTTPTIDVSSDNIAIDTNKHICSLNGNAEVSFVNDKGKYNFSAKKIIIFYNKNEIKKPQKITAFGRVNFTYGDIKISSHNCKYDMEKILFKNEVVIVDKKLGTIKADEAVYNIETKKIEITSKNKVNVIINKNI